MFALRLTRVSGGQLSPLLGHLRQQQQPRGVAARGMKDATVAEAKELLSGGHKYLDVRTAEEYEMGHAEGSTNIPVMVKAAGVVRFHLASAFAVLSCADRVHERSCHATYKVWRAS